MSTSPIGVPSMLNAATSLNATTSKAPLPTSTLAERIKEWLPRILLLIVGAIFTIAGCIVMALTKQILYGLLCVVGGLLLALGLLLKPENCIYRNAESAARSLSNALE
ncbi:hypothetical protein ACH8ZP_01760 [Chlamydia pneumoniae]|uniref:Uncharacterized protein n=1 Tax=Chlamydia pneumoniae TaxID=83558 RepID=Q9K285_CHLPN|nr:hypothetical protein [Chlamydia pneumoniae]AAF38241.1 hypothetical protein CP_0396 [Chlamydia pneumoniae AR39]CRI32862.1 Uncharacterized protein BN1224_Wien1_A_03690 [Chlamydia pneumoniae]CRI35725.1 Uncharacterized protein BN1224_CM1_A_03720 [Chlamydia pneumoniae]CRI36852.1 Uncharacterized protein BN1224_CV14_A_03710 [Chlamydia pneumoniae]CRI37975.1 Uncharacterized protein BN1224_CV15_B_02980 [Chlamydia pneumoniae]